MSTIAENLCNKFDALSESVGGTRKLALCAAAGAGAVAAAYYVVPCAWQALFRPEPDPYGPGEVIQPNVLSDLKDESLFLVIYLKCDADLKGCAAAAARLQSHVVVINQSRPGGSTFSRDHEIIAGVGFGQNLYTTVVGHTTRPFSYVPRAGGGGIRTGNNASACSSMTSTGGDIFIHAKSNSHSKLFELADRMIKSFPRGSIDCFEDLYGFIYKDGRDFTGCPYGRANPSSEADRLVASVNDYTQGSFCLTQKWLHDMNKVHSMSKRTLENIFGIYKDGTDMRFRCPSSHVARMRAATDQNNQNIMIYRQSMPFGSLSSREKGLFFVGFADDPERFDALLDRMVGACPDGQSDQVFQVSRCLTGQYWYFPSIAELRLIARKSCAIASCLAAFKCNKTNIAVSTRKTIAKDACYVQGTAGSAGGTTVVVNSGDSAVVTDTRAPSLMKRLTFGCGSSSSSGGSTTVRSNNNRSTTTVTTTKLAGPAVEVYSTGDATSANNNSNSQRVIVRNDEAGVALGDAGAVTVNNSARLPVMNASGDVVSSAAAGGVQVSYLPRVPEPYPSKLYFSNNGQISAAYRRNG